METAPHFNNGSIVQADRSIRVSPIFAVPDRSEGLAVPNYDLSIGDRKVLSLPANMFDGTDGKRFSMVLFENMELTEYLNKETEQCIFYRETLLDGAGTVVVLFLDPGQDALLFHDINQRPFQMYNIGAKGCIVRGVQCPAAHIYVIEGDNIVSSSVGKLDCSGNTPLLFDATLGPAAKCIIWEGNGVQQACLSTYIPIVLVLSDHKAKVNGMALPQEIIALGAYDFQGQCSVDFEDVLVFGLNTTDMRDDLWLTFKLFNRTRLLSLCFQRDGSVKVFNNET
jgi:hypothetical protein